MKVSIIVPVYNAEKYLDRCVESIIKQTEEDIEILLIDDDSTDLSGRMCEEWAKKDSRIRVFHIENIGVSNARNQGIKYSNSPYIMFVDSDDWISEDMVETLIERIEDSDSQAVFCNYITVKNGKELHCENVLEYKIYQNENVSEIIKNMFGGGKYYSSIWRGIYRKDVIQSNNILFRDLKFAEDLLFNLEYLMNCKKVQIIDDEMYYYRVNDTSALQSLKNDVNEIEKVPHAIYSLLNNYNKLDTFNNEIQEEIALTVSRVFAIENRYLEFKKNISKLKFAEKDKLISNGFKSKITGMYFEKKWIKLYNYLWFIKIKKYLCRG